MTKSQIKAELRRSAMEDDSPFTARASAFDTAGLYCWEEGRHVYELEVNDEWRNLFLLVAEAL